ncbi:MAG: AAA family ATPase [Chlamydiia bacterium]|nr:AAA family ATPase [Chlamydiia bacterium]
MKKLPIRVQSIEKILSENEYVYVDKTGLIKKLIDEGAPHYFMSRPRRFGKSLFINTLEQIFKGNKELFKGFEIYNSEYDWQEYPVLHFDFARIESRTSVEFENALKRKLQSIAGSLGLSIEVPTIQEGIETLVTKLSKKNRVVVLVDEYDSAIINNLKDPALAEKNRDLLKGFFGTLKGLDEYLKFTFTTGVSKFSQVSLFSGPNNLKDITMDPRYAGMMGYTEEELKKVFSEHIRALVKNKKKEGNLAAEDTILEEIRTWYNGYRFSHGETCVYNPFSTLNYLDEQEAKTYWYSSGTPSFLIDQVKKHPESMVSLDGTTATQEKLMDISSFDHIDVEALMYQTGYFTIKGYNPISKRYQLGLPNEEVRSAFINSLVQNFAPITNLRSSRESVKALEEHHPSLLFKHIEIGLSSFAYQVFVDAKEQTYQAMLLSMLYGMGFDPLSEKATNTGRIDVVLEIPKTTYILELKLNGSADSALKQIYEKQYFKPYTHKEKHIVIIGANFSSELRNISDWKGELLSPSGEKIRDLFPDTDQ